MCMRFLKLDVITWLMLLLAGIALGVILLFAVLGLYAHPSADDFCMAAGVQQQGLWTHLGQHYLEWSGRYAGNTFYAIYPLVLGFLDGYRLIAGLVMLMLFTAAAFLLARLLQRRMNDLPVVVAALVFTAVYVLGMRSPASSLYWMAGALSYQSANVLLLILAGLMLELVDRQRRGQHTGWIVAVMGCVLVLLVGTNETGMLMAVLAVSVLWLSRLGRGWRFALPWLWLVVIAAVCSVIVFVAPGNAVREATFPLRHDGLRALTGSIGMGSWMLVAWLQSPVLLAVTLLVPCLTLVLGWPPARQFQPSRRHLLAMAGITLALPLLLQFPAWWAMGGWPPPRTVDAVYFVFLLGWLATVAGLTLYRIPQHWRENALTNALPHSLQSAFLILIVLLGLAIFTNGRFQRAYQDVLFVAPAFDDYMQQRYALIGAALGRGQGFLTVPDFRQAYPRSVYFNDILPQPQDWRNACYARYFGLQGIRREPGPP